MISRNEISDLFIGLMFTMNKVSDSNPATNIHLKPFKEKVHKLIKGTNIVVK